MKCRACYELGIIFERDDLSQHVRLHHQMSCGDYKKKYNCDVIDPEIKKQRGLSRKTRKENIFECPLCIAENGENLRFSSINYFKKHCFEIKNVAHSHLIYTDAIDKSEYAECFCGFRNVKISSHIKEEHGMSVEEYKAKHGPVLAKKYLEKINQNWGDVSGTRENRNYKHKCRVEGCSNIIENNELVCIQCKLKQARKVQEDKFIGKVQEIDFVRCKCKLENEEICNWPATRLTGHIEHHGYTAQQYKHEFNSLMIARNIIENISEGRKGVRPSEEAKKNMRKHRTLTSWNSGLTKEDHPGLQAISDKAKIRLSQLHNNNWHTNPVSGVRNGNFGKSTWSKGLTSNLSELIERRNENNKGIDHHKSNFGHSDIYDMNKFVEHYTDEQSKRVKLSDKRCIECESEEELIVHHMNPRELFDKYDLIAHNYQNLITLCNKCHSSIAQRIDKAILMSENSDLFEKNFPVEFEIFKKWSAYTEQRFVSCLPIDKTYIEKLPIKHRTDLSELIFDELRNSGFPYSFFSNEELLKDFENIEKSSVTFENNTLRNYNFSGSKIREYFIHEQYINFLELFEKDDVLIKVIRNRLGLDWKKTPEFFNMNKKIIIKGFEVLFPDKRFSKYKASTAKWIIENFSNSENIFDYSSGWGDRLLGCVAAKRNYFGMDTNEKLVKELNEVMLWLSKHRKFEGKIICENSINLNEQITCAYSCPPYGDQEAYKGSLYSSDRDWFEKFMNPVIINCHNKLTNSGRFICHLPVRLVYMVKHTLLTKFKILNEIEVPNKHDAFHAIKEKDRVNEIILVCEK